jgi:NADPH2:quinone reductase
VSIFADPKPATLDRLAAHHADGDTCLVIEQTYPLTDALDALAHFGAGTKGKLVITIA